MYCRAGAWLRLAFVSSANKGAQLTSDTLSCVAIIPQWKVNMIDDHFQAILVSNRTCGYRIFTFGQALTVSRKKYKKKVPRSYYISELLVFPFPIHHIHILQHNITSLHL